MEGSHYNFDTVTCISVFLLLLKICPALNISATKEQSQYPLWYSDFCLDQGLEPLASDVSRRYPADCLLFQSAGITLLQLDYRAWGHWYTHTHTHIYICIHVHTYTHIYSSKVGYYVIPVMHYYHGLFVVFGTIPRPTFSTKYIRVLFWVFWSGS